MTLIYTGIQCKKNNTCGLPISTSNIYVANAMFNSSSSNMICMPRQPSLSLGTELLPDSASY